VAYADITKRFGVSLKTIGEAVGGVNENILDAMLKDGSDRSTVYNAHITGALNKKQSDRLAFMFDFLSTGILSFAAEKDRLIRIIITHLQQENYLTGDTIAKYAGVSLEALETFVSDTESDVFSVAEKYNLSVVVMLLDSVLNSQTFPWSP
jgi:hypothetical protein